MGGYSDGLQRVWMANSAGTFAFDDSDASWLCP